MTTKRKTEPSRPSDSLIAKLQRDIAKRDAMIRECIGAVGKDGPATKVGANWIPGLYLLGCINGAQNIDKHKRQARAGATRIQKRAYKLLRIEWIE